MDAWRQLLDRGANFVTPLVGRRDAMTGSSQDCIGALATCAPATGRTSCADRVAAATVDTHGAGVMRDNPA
jgi:hypothetical protein